MEQTPEQLQAAIVALGGQRALLGDAVVDAALVALRAQLVAAAARAAPAQRLKQVSALFVDVVGSTAIGQRLSPEQISAVMDGALRRFTAIVEARGGRVLQYTGDGMLAAFGADAAREDDVESAVHAGLEILADTRAAAPAVRARHGVPDFDVRVGIHTGRVLLGAGVDAEGSIRGSAVNLAARMEQTAPPGCLRISHDSYRHVEGLFDVTEQPPVLVKGVEQPVRGWLVERARPRAFGTPTRGIEGVATPMVGRDVELARLLAAYDGVGTRRTLAAATIEGEAGIGKSRLVAEFRQALEARGAQPWLLLGRAEPRAAQRPYRLLYDTVARHLLIADDDSADQARRKFVAGLGPLFADTGEAPLHVLGTLVGLDFGTSPHVEALRGDEARLRERGFDAGAELLRRLGADPARPVVLLLDDIHWADAPSLDFVRHLVASRRDLPLLVVALTRPRPEGEAPAWPADETIALRPLDPGHSRALADMLLRRTADVPDALRRLLTDSAEGNPFYMEELVKMLLDDGVIVGDGAAGWRVVADRFSVARVPQTLVGVLQARLDALAPADRLTLQRAAIVGATFSEPALAAVDAAAPDALPVLLARQFVRPAPGVAGGAREYAFGHHLLHQVCYESVLHGVRIDGHARVGAFWRARAEVDSPQRVDAPACRALAEACEHGRVADPAALIDWFEGQFTHYLGAHVGRSLRPLAQAVVGLAEAHCGADSPVAARALTNLARVVLQQSDTALAGPLLRRALAIQQRELGDEHIDTARTHAVLGGYHQGRGEFALAEPPLRRAFELRERLLGPEHPLTLRALDVLSHVVAELGRLDEAEASCRRLLEVSERTFGADDPQTAAALTALGEVLTKRGCADAAEPLIRRSLDVRQRWLAPEHPDIGLTLWHLAQTLRAQGRVGEAEPIARQTLELWENAMGDGHEWTAWGLISLAELRLQGGDGAEASALAERALGIYERLFGPAHAQVGVTLDVLARALALDGDPRAGSYRQRSQAISVGAGPTLAS